MPGREDARRFEPVDRGLKRVPHQRDVKPYGHLGGASAADCRSHRPRNVTQLVRRKDWTEMGLLIINGTLRVKQFWPEGRSDADTATVDLAASQPFVFVNNAGHRAPTHALDNA